MYSTLTMIVVNLNIAEVELCTLMIRKCKQQLEYFLEIIHTRQTVKEPENHNNYEYASWLKTLTPMKGGSSS